MRIIQVQVDVSGFNASHVVNPSLLTQRFSAKRQRLADGAKLLLDAVKESSDWFPPLKSALSGLSALIKHYGVVVEQLAVARN